MNRLENESATAMLHVRWLMTLYIDRQGSWLDLLTYLEAEKG